jgi:hypothetical protein
MEPPAATLQLILPTDKRNPCFNLYQTEDGRSIHVYYGLERLEVVPAAANHPAYRMLVARLYFGVSLSGETLRVMMNQITNRDQAGAEERASAAPEVPPPADTRSDTSPGGRDGTLEPDLFAPAKVPEPGGEPPVLDWFASKFDPSPWQPPPGEATLCDHAGVMLYARALASLPAVVDPPRPILGQWLAATLLGAHNIEQTKLLNWSDLSLLLGTVVRFPGRNARSSARSPPRQPSPPCCAGISNNSASPSCGAMTSTSIPTPSTTPACSACSRAGAPPSVGPTRS